MKINLIDNADQASLINNISWTRLVDQLRKAGEFGPGEIVAQLEIKPTGIIYRVIRKHQ